MHYNVVKTCILVDKNLKKAKNKLNWNRFLELMDIILIKIEKQVLLKGSTHWSYAKSNFL